MSDDNLTVLAIDTATKACSAALLHEGQEYSRYELLPQQHAHRILPMVDELITEAGIEFNQVDLLAFGEGPGAFTGIRIASGVIQGLALGWDKPVVSISSLLAIAEAYFADNSMTIDTDMDWAVLLDARMEEVYLLQGSYQVSDRTLLASDVQLVSPDQAATEVLKAQNRRVMIGLGDVAEEYPQVTKLFSIWKPALPSALSVARLALKNADKAKNIDDELPAPVYLRNQVADTIEQRKQKKLSGA